MNCINPQGLLNNYSYLITNGTNLTHNPAFAQTKHICVSMTLSIYRIVPIEEHLRLFKRGGIVTSDGVSVPVRMYKNVYMYVCILLSFQFRIIALPDSQSGIH